MAEKIKSFEELNKLVNGSPRKEDNTSEKAALRQFSANQKKKSAKSKNNSHNRKKQGGQKKNSQQNNNKRKKHTTKNPRPNMSHLAVRVTKKKESNGHMNGTTHRTQMSISLTKGSKIYMDKDFMHKCTSSPIIERINVDLFGGLMLQRMDRCRSCGKVFLRNEDIESFKILNGQHNNYYKLSYSTLEYGDNASKILPKEAIHPKDYLIRTTLYQCTSGQHALKDIWASVKILTPSGDVEETQIQAIYCKECKQYFILESEYIDLVRRGIPICKVVTIEVFRKLQFSKYQLNEESLLHSLGYNVSATKNLSQFRRQKLLRIIIQEEIMTRGEIISHLDYLIRRSKGNDQLKKAVEKWTLDREFVKAVVQDIPSAEVRSITRKITHWK